MLIVLFTSGNVIGQKARLPETINSYEKVFVPLLTADGKFLYIDRKNYPGNTGSIGDHDDIWRSRIIRPEDFGAYDTISVPLQEKELSLLLNDKSMIDIEKFYKSKLKPSNGSTNSIFTDSISFLEPENLGSPLNTTGSDVLFSITPDGTKALVYGIYEPFTGLKRQGFSISKLIGGKWAFPEPLDIEGYYNNPVRKNGYSTVFFYGSMSSDCSVLILALNRDEGLGDLDLYVSFHIGGNKWTTPRNLGSIINTGKTESSPFLALDGKTLYFASDGRDDSTMLDLYMTRRLDDTWANWSEPVSLGHAINSEFDEKGICLNALGSEVYIVSRDTSVKRYGIYKADLPDFARPGPYTIYTGNFFSVKGSHLKYHNEIVKVALFNGNDSLPYYTTEIEGSQYTLCTSAERGIRIRFESRGCKPVEFVSEIKNSIKPEIIKKDILFSEIEKSKTIRLTLLFDYDSDLVTDSAIAALSGFIKSNPGIREITITGHADESGTTGYNMDLSMRRARNIQKALLQSGIAGDIIKVSWQGSKSPVSADLSRNRRVEIEAVIE